MRLALVEEENRPGKKEVMNRSKYQKKRLLELKFPDLGGTNGVGATWVPSMVGCGGQCVCMPRIQPPICFK